MLAGCPACRFSWGESIMQKDLGPYYAEEYGTAVADRTRFPMPKEYFSNTAAQFKPGRSQYHVRLAKHFGPRKIESVLDFGAGLGTTLYWARELLGARRLAAVEGDALSQEYLRYLGADPLTGDIFLAKDHFAEPFDCIICSHFLEHIAADALPDFAHMLQELLTPGGVLVLEVPHDDWFRYPQRAHNHPPHTGFYSEPALQLLFSRFAVRALGAVGTPAITTCGPAGRLLGRCFVKASRLSPIRRVRGGDRLLLVAEHIE
jgi:SAM-dependent methyltransferase